ncbi:hypothetical protein DEU56DRAFT_754814 [Suillus clintonianus]|uniref:uncharacterized protein n=1 Tax=Suillus clintonianus TaxID=1904413 RepID=UPI001B871222|nr:uncharacterized protein DEU56DRAFT_754814 [Suillus clintonianus]KAG2141832.1 hypothetical protein DEU56DRAFT_754814 [Suillus clintonianus]
MPSKARSLFELTRLHLFPVGCDSTFWPFGKIDDELAYLTYEGLTNRIGSCHQDRGFSSSGGSPCHRLLYVFAYWFKSLHNRCCFTPSLWRGVSVNEALDALTFSVPRYGQSFGASWAVPIAWVATTGQFNWGMILNFSIASCCWACLYDTIYACQDKKDDEKAGVKSMAVRLGNGIRPVLSLFDLTFFVSLLCAGYLNGQGLLYYVISVIAPFLLCLWHIWSFDHNDPKDCWEKFTIRITDISTQAVMARLWNERKCIVLSWALSSKDKKQVTDEFYVTTISQLDDR